MKIVIDKRPQCKSLSKTGKPCDLHKGHDGLHEWSGMQNGYEEWK